MTAVVALVTWVLNAAVGLWMLGRWRGRAGLLVYSHLATASLGLTLWIIYLTVDRPAAVAWAAFVVLNVNNGLGDTALTRGWRRRNPHAARSSGRDYLNAAVELMSGRRPIVLAHGMLAGATYFLVLLAALGI